MEFDESNSLASMTSTGSVNPLPCHPTVSVDTGIPVILSSFDIHCDNCQQSVNSTAANYVPHRQDLLLFLQSSFDGFLVLTAFETLKELPESTQNILCNLIIDREVNIICKREKVSAANPLKKLEYVYQFFLFQFLAFSVAFE